MSQLKFIDNMSIADLQDLRNKLFLLKIHLIVL